MTNYSSSMRTWRLKAAAAGGLGLAAMVIAGIALDDRVPPLDTWIVAHLYSRPETAPAMIATVLSGAGTIAGLALLLAAASGLVRRRRARGARLLPRHGVLLVACLATVALQAAFRRPGPPVTSQDWTYPSGHVTVLAALVFTAFVISLELTAAWRVTVLAGGVTTLAAVSASRVTLGEHYLVDVVAALLATIGAGLLAVAALNLRPRHRVPG
ncbi:phosphatase PAP2 family protein [Actinomadura soli]|uniref:Phosphatase PAP2 family protein n=1 Tax=Actinomadura soli TaxID=2508997 RepID=A0A5C4JGM1_9ACTN|nr:phosphatase PAP2 family protein [Actinomadura soli]TMR04821.1 phosphatase PAP2 family protein [Actinomadura soli]